MPRRRVLLSRDVRFASVLEKTSPFLPPLNLVTIHYPCFIFVSLAASLVFWGSSNPSFGIPQMTTWQQVILWLLIIIGSSVWVSIWTILVRKHAFERRFQEIDSPNCNGDKASATSPSGTNDSAALTRTNHVVFAEESREKAASTSVPSKDAAIQRQVQGTNY
ncbi:hypothetical protein DL764_003447 [Monosporascus ibericus]|uniref:Uncharacterized protein n=1 Tax=Monosporascus ibericus TaxID=155417 RepID=A0A4Q4TJW9_9PEZI|nr:hypothetical protein DL764_003447 [Monosporascus ibericus]